MKVLYLHRTQGKGVEAVHIWGIVDSLRALGHEVRISSPAGEEKDSGPVAGGALPKPGLLSRLVGNLPEFAFELAEIGYNAIALRSALKLIGAEKKPDFIYERYAIFAVAGALLAKRWGIPLVLEINYTSHSPLVRERSKALLPLAHAFDRWLFRRADGFAAVSSFLREHLINDFGVAADKVLVIPNAADPDKFPVVPRDEALAAELGLGTGPVIGFVGGFYPWHGVGLLVSAFAQLKATMPLAKLVLVGDGPEKATIAAQVRDLGFSSDVIFTGKVPHDQLARYISLFSVGVMPDSNEYGSPMKVFEYMAMGKPVVAPDYAPLLDVIEPFKQGIIFKRQDVSSLREALEALLRDEAVLAEMAVQSRNYVEEERNWLNNGRLTLGLAKKN